MDPAAGLITPARPPETTDPAEGISPPEIPPTKVTGEETTRSANGPGPSVVAEPNPVPAGEGLGQTTISWSTAGRAGGQVWVRQGEAAEVLFAQGPTGSTAAPWIQAGIEYEFRLYTGSPGSATRILLASVVVVRQEPASLAPAAGPVPPAARRPPERPFVRAQLAPSESGWGGRTAIVEWSTGGRQPGRLYRVDPKGQETLVDQGAGGSTTIGGVGRRRVTLLRLYGNLGGRPLLAQTALINRRPFIQAVPNPVPKSEGLGSTTICWATSDGAVGHVFLLTEDGKELPFAAGAEDSQPVNWIAPNVAYRFRLYAGRDRERALGSVTVTQGSEWREIGLDLAFLGALAAPVVLLLIVVVLVLRAVL